MKTKQANPSRPLPVEAGSSGAVGRPARVPKIAEFVLQELRRQIVSGEITEGSNLPTEGQLVARFGVSRTPIREALSILEQEGFVRSIPRRGIVVVRKSKTEVVDMIRAWAALESMAARLITTTARKKDISSLRGFFKDFGKDRLPQDNVEEYSKANIAKSLGKSEAWICRRLQLITQLPCFVKEAIYQGTVSSWTANRILIPLARANCEHAKLFIRYFLPIIEAS